MNQDTKRFYVYIKFVGGDSIRADYQLKSEMEVTIKNLTTNPGARWMSFAQHIINLDNVTTIEHGKS